MEVLRTKQALTQAIRRARANGKKIGLVPTMGALHAGHMSLIEIARQHADAVVASIFVNPTQFGPNEDFSRYPRPESEDLQKLEAAEVDVAYLPTVEEMYKHGFSTSITAGKIATELCGAFRPGHFDGVATVVTKLLMQSQADVAVFGEKDYQQLHIIRQVVRDLDLHVQIIGAPILREADGLAMSSRNRYLSEKERQIAAQMYRVLKETASAIPLPPAGGGRGRSSQGDTLLQQAKAALLAAGFTRIDYVELREAETLAPIEAMQNPARLLAAAYLGTTRLIDNIVVEY